jgi:hypothetical protein
MPATKVNEFLLSLAHAIAQDVGLSMSDSPKGMWIHEAVEGPSMGVYTVLRIYPGGEEFGNFADMRVPCISVQADTRGTDAQLVTTQAWKVHEALLNSDGTPWLEKNITAKKFDSSEAIIDDTSVNNWRVWVKRFSGTPGIIGRDDSNRHLATSNYDMEFQPAAQADGA